MPLLGPPEFGPKGEIFALATDGVAPGEGDAFTLTIDARLTAALAAADNAARHCNVLLVVGTSAEVYPAAALPRLGATRAVYIALLLGALLGARLL